MTAKRTKVGREVEEALGEVLAHVRGEVDLPCRIVDDPSAERILALRKRMKLSRRKFADLGAFCGHGCLHFHCVRPMRTLPPPEARPNTGSGPGGRWLEASGWP